MPLTVGYELPGLKEQRAHLLKALLDQPELPLSRLPEMAGLGVYAIYYRGKNKLYNCYGKSFANTPIYVGKATASGSRKGIAGASRSLSARLRQHVRSITEAGLNPGDFVVRVLAVGPETESFVPMLEIFAIEAFTPLWNSVIDGFGNHAPGKGRSEQAPSSWDVLHPGRAIVKLLKGVPECRERILERVYDYVARPRRVNPL